MLLLVNIFCVYLATIGFGLLVNVPKRALNMGGLVSVSGWLVYYYINTYISGYVFANLFGTFVVGLLSILASRYKKMPVIIFNIPALVPLVPGGQAYQVMKSLAISNYALAKTNLIQMVFIAGAIASGFLFSEFLNQLYIRWRIKKANQKKG
ncbi:threonine/serine exporter family protein [Apilactobacillus apisilvae]|uniref:Threonine/serine exporter family protein n=1 Tax=Apilactobacillus apisilvae TaxID=2923364 RepID=A0ABY4PIM2_9LACO|nr:threonine/serine exporter family protein [Apilactobacillus apisilvae]UQS85653.1 threonine/serine exporter family protein [Apilactobacillus apisilvae]